MLAFFDELLDGERVALSEMRERIPEHSEVWRGRWERMTEKLDAAEDGALGWDRNLNWARGLVVLVSTLLIGAVVIFAPAEEEAWFAAGAVGLVNLVVLSALSATRFKRLDPDHVERVKRWQAFELWTEDFPRLSDDPPATLDLWKRVLVRHREADARLGQDPGAGRRRRLDRLALEFVRVRRRLQRRLVRWLQLQLGVRQPGRARELVERRWRRLFGWRRRLVVSAAVASRRSSPSSSRTPHP